MTTLRKKMDGDTSQQRRQYSGAVISLEDELHQAILQGHNSTRLLQSTIACLREQLHEQSPISSTQEEQRGGNGSEMENEMQRWKGQCRTLEEAAQEKSMQLDEMEWDRQNLRDENTDLRRKLQQREKELNDWKEDCMFFAVKFMNWGPSLLKWGPALNHEFERKLLQRRRKKKSTTVIQSDKKLISNVVVVGSLRSTFMEQSGAAGVDHQHQNTTSKDCNQDHHQTAGHSLCVKRWTSNKRKCLSCSSAPGSPSNRDIHK
ncbi:unnamed protein product [Calypogeia fissa]